MDQNENAAQHYGGKKSKRKIGLKGSSMSGRLTVILLLIVALAGLGAAGYFWNDARSAKQQTPEGVAQKNQEETDQVVSSLASIILIEGEDKPTVARVENPDVLKKANQDFYKNVQVGDYLVLYPQRAIIYRLGEKKIVNIAPIINTSQQTQDATQAVTEDTTKTDDKKTTTTPTPPTKTTR